MLTKWKRSPRGKIFGVVTGLAEWKELDPQAARIIAFVISMMTMPASIIIYLLLALFLPMQGEGEYMGPRRERTARNDGSWRNDATWTEANAQRKHSGPVDYEDVKWEDKSNEDLRREYEDLKKKVEAMENDMFDREKDWDERFKES